MSDIPGIQHSGVPYIWPHGLYRPSFDCKLVYLDLNHWIYLAQAATGHRSRRAPGHAFAWNRDPIAWAVLGQCFEPLLTPSYHRSSARVC
jgi:hypothetical protein